VVRGYSTQLFGVNIGATYIPHGVMIGAGIVSLIQAANIIIKGYREQSAEREAGTLGTTVSATEIPRAFGMSGVLFLLGAVALALISGIISSVSVSQLIVWLLYATFSALISTVLVGMSAMHSGWFPGFAITVIFLTIGMFLKIPAAPLALLTGFGWILRGKGKDPDYEIAGRKQQFIAEAIGGVVALVVVLLFMRMHFDLDLLPPVSRVFATTIGAGADPSIVRELVLWAIPGAILQAVGGSGKALGILFATGLLINNPIYGIGVLAAVVLRLIIGTEPMEVREAGLIAGDGIYGFVTALIRTFI